MHFSRMSAPATEPWETLLADAGDLVLASDAGMLQADPLVACCSLTSLLLSAGLGRLGPESVASCRAKEPAKEAP